MDIKVLGTGCSRCKTLYKTVCDAVSELKLNANITKIEDIVEIMKFGVSTMPALIIDGKVVVKGRVPNLNEVKDFLNKR